MISVKNKVFCITLGSDKTSVDVSEIHSLLSNQEETDTTVILYAKYAQQKGYKQCMIHTPDSDIFHLLMYYAHTFNMKSFLATGVKDKWKIINISESADDYGSEFCEAILGLHVYTGEDTNCAFKGKGKLRPFKRLKGLPRYQSVLRRLGKDWEITPEDRKELERFTCIIYGYNRVHSICRVRALMLQKMVGADNNLSASSKVDLSELPPCLSSLEPHMQRVNYRLAQWKRSHENIVECPPPEEHG